MTIFIRFVVGKPVFFETFHNHLPENEKIFTVESFHKRFTKSELVTVLILLDWKFNPRSFCDVFSFMVF